MNILMVSSTCDIDLRLLEIPEGLDYVSVWHGWSGRWNAKRGLLGEPEQHSLARCAKMLSFVEHLVFEHGCKPLSYKELAL